MALVTAQFRRKALKPPSPILLNDSGVTVKECARDSGLKSRSANNTESMRFVRVVHDNGRRLNQSPFRSRTEVSSPRARQFSEHKEKRPLLAGKSNLSRKSAFNKV